MYAAACMPLCNPRFEACRIAVENKLRREVNLLKDGVRVAVLPDVAVDVCIAADDDMCAVTAAGIKQAGCEKFRALAGAIRVV